MAFSNKLLPARHGAIIVSCFLIASCGSSSVNDTRTEFRQLHLACQTTQCECLDEKKNLLSDRKTTEIKWLLNGDATCPKGFLLKRVDLDFLGRPK
jgi:hypothetical protein